jgi:hypothetical protein
MILIFMILIHVRLTRKTVQQSKVDAVVYTIASYVELIAAAASPHKRPNNKQAFHEA